MSDVAKELRFLPRVGIAAALAIAFLMLAFPSKEACRKGGIQACAARALVHHPEAFVPIIAPKFVLVDWQEGPLRIEVQRAWPLMIETGWPVLRRLLIGGFAILFAGIVLSFLIPSWLARAGARGKRHERGARIVDSKTLKTLVKNLEPGGLTIASVPVPRAIEPLSFRFCGSPGSGKTQAISRLVMEFRARNNPAVVADSGGELMAGMYREGDFILNPFDSRSVEWSPFAEIRTPADTVRIVKSIIPDADGESAQWHKYSQQLLAVTIDRLCASGRDTNGWLVFFCCAAEQQEWAELCANSAASRWFSGGNERAFASVASVISTYITPLSYLTPGAGSEGFSITKFVAECRKSGAVLWLPYRSDTRPAVATLISSVLDIATAAAMAQEVDRARRLFLVVDELAALGKINSLPDALAQGRKFGLSALAGYQSISQLRNLYGEHTSKTLLACLQSQLVLSTSDFESADALSKDLGQAEVAREERSTSGRIGDSTSHTKREARTVEQTILPSEIQSLPPLQGYLRFAGNFPVARVQVPILELPRKVSPFHIKPDVFSQVERPAEPKPAAVAATVEAEVSPLLDDDEAILRALNSSEDKGC
ncbi:MAG: type IV secretion system DNA-binding domain-containing protein [Rhodocyclaceae bacterium]|nr:type IV secretion system DNA-binding domain-containing protein [Rhodocyclaceae bacterium]